METAKIVDKDKEREGERKIEREKEENCLRRR